MGGASGLVRSAVCMEVWGTVVHLLGTALASYTACCVALAYLGSERVSESKASGLNGDTCYTQSGALVVRWCGM